jgi:hypothetical protein
LAYEPGGRVRITFEKLNMPPFATTIFPMTIACGFVVSNLATALSSPESSCPV